MSVWCDGILEEVERSVRGPENVSMQIFGLTMTVIFFLLLSQQNVVTCNIIFRDKFKFCFRSFFTVVSLFLMRQSHTQSSAAKEDIEQLL